MPTPTSTAYTLPPPRLAKPILLCAAIMALTASRRLAYPGSVLHSTLLPLSPSAAGAAMWLQWGVFWFFYVAHAVECAIMARMLRGHRVLVGSRAWWAWMGECFVGGKFCFEHLEAVAGGKKGT
ncbi:hypothetical protein BU23DRAFT_555999 [Bimuria novae-zelandiae CBS 107.79]|uniref:Uncharacterized protein n=1 Tax=Bimuria novae-zelandiae CBS 107.79 TaxID=1447943 RepID=A0A6A5V8W4_9PLEO|nr:hypothetical protein BU23DRAFT_555999 [Bimuria novae-zelandiae CBS 107.79]